MRHFPGLGILPQMPHAAFTPPICSQDPDSLVSDRRRYRTALARVIDLSRSHSCGRYLLVSFHSSGVDGACHQATGKTMGGRLMKKELSFPALLECFFMQRLMAQRQVSPHTIRSYRDTFRLLLQFAAKRLHKLPSAQSWPGLESLPRSGCPHPVSVTPVVALQTRQKGSRNGSLPPQPSSRSYCHRLRFPRPG